MTEREKKREREREKVRKRDEMEREREIVGKSQRAFSSRSCFSVFSAQP